MMPQGCGEFNGSKGVCGGGALALDGKTGDVLWQHWTRKDILFVDCSANVNSQKTNDCILSGKGGVLITVDGQTGTLIWELTKPSGFDILNVYSAQYITDMDSDGIPDLLVAHTSENSGHLLLINGRNGQIIGRIETPNKESIYTVPRVMVQLDGTLIVIFATGTIETPGSLYTLPLSSLAASDKTKCVNIWSDNFGVSSGIVLADMNSDGLEDIIITSGSKVSILNATDYSPFFNITSKAANMQILIGPTPGYFNDDTIPDLLITYMIGPSFPTFYYSETWVSNGKGGENLIEEPILGTGDITAPGVTISYSGIGNDMFLYWLTTCTQLDSGMIKEFEFAQGSTVRQQSHADLCRLRFNTSMISKLYLLNQHIQPPGVLIYSTETYWTLEHNQTKEETTPKPENKNQAWLPSHSSFRHKTQEQPPLLQFPHAHNEENPILDYSRYPQNPIQSWEPQPVSYGDPIGYPLNSEFMDENLYPQEEEPGVPINEGRDERANYKTREKRSTGFEQGSLPHAASTATLAPSLSGEGIDVVFLSYWETPSTNVRVVAGSDLECVKTRIRLAVPNNIMNADLIRENAERECMGVGREQGLPSPNSLGQMTVYRMNIGCKCSTLKPGSETCSIPLPMDDQSYSHRAGDVYFKKRPHI